MKVKKYIAPTMPEAMTKIRMDLGREAVILHSKVVYKGGFLGLFKKKNIEVIAAIDEDTPLPSRKEREVVTVKKSNFKDEIQAPSLKSFRTDENKEQKILQEITELKEMMAKLPQEERKLAYGQSIPKPFQKIFQRLERQEINAEIVASVREKMLAKYYVMNGEITEEDAEKLVYDYFLEQLLPFSFEGISLQKKYINVVGPTGVGKTTTLAKMAAHCKIQQKKSIAFITTDTYRIAAVEQLKTYAKILEAPIEVCYNAVDVKKALEKFQPYDMVFIDTAGRNFRNEKYVDDLKTMFDFTEEMESFLVFSLTAKEKDMKDIYERFSKISIDKFIFTKLDETSSVGSLINFPLKYKKGIAYITNGQDVPDDIIEVNRKFIVETVLGDEIYD